MPKRSYLPALVAGLLVPTMAVWSSSRADDFGKFLERAAGNALRQTLSPEEPRRPSTSARKRQEATPAVPGATPGAGQGRAPGLISTLVPGLSQDQTHGEPLAIRTQDGWTLVAHRYKPPGTPRAGAMPVILCHGLTYNAVFWDLIPECSFAEYLSSQGFDVWAVSLRGSGLSQKWVWRADDLPSVFLGTATRKLTHGKIPPSGYTSIDPKYANWNLDHHSAYDVPALVTLVRRHTKAAEVAWVGHSMGGIVALCHLERYGNPGIGRLVTIGSQVTMPRGRLPLEFCNEMIQARQQQLAGQVTRQQLLAQQLAVQTQAGIHNLFFNVPNADPRVYEALSGGWATDIPAIDLMRQYTTLSSKGVLLDAQQRYNYAEHLDRITIPILVGCGAQDLFAPPVVQRYLYNHVGSTDKTLVIFGQAHGMTVDAGHDDALVGLNSRAQVFPVIARWLAPGS
jgi:pimeloyl-ACP methyl ester carboxylesterase